MPEERNDARQLSPVLENYLEIIFHQEIREGAARASSIAEAAGVSRPLRLILMPDEELSNRLTGPDGIAFLQAHARGCAAAFVYKKFHTRKGAVIGLALGTVCLTVVMLLWNYLITPIYMGMDREEIVVPMLIPVFLPFNLVKGGLNMALTLLIYKPVVTALRKARLVPASHAPVEGKGKLSAGFLLFSLALLATFVVLALVLMGIL